MTLIGQTIKSQDRPAAEWVQDTAGQNNISSTTYVTGSPVVDLTFTAPTSGRILVLIAAGIRDDTNNNRGYVAPELYEGTDATGTLILAANAEARGIVSISHAADYAHMSRATVIAGLTPGATHYVRLMQKAETTTSASVDITMRELTVVPAT